MVHACTLACMLDYKSALQRCPLYLGRLRGITSLQGWRLECYESMLGACLCHEGFISAASSQHA